MVNEHSDNQAGNRLKGTQNGSVCRTNVFYSDLKAGNADEAYGQGHENHDKSCI